MKEIFEFTVICRSKALDILLICFLPTIFVMWLIGQYFPMQQEFALGASFITVGGISTASYWLIKRNALDFLIVELNRESFQIIYSSGHITRLALNSISKHRYFVTRGTHNLFLDTSVGKLKLTTNTLFGDDYSTSQFQAMATALRQRLKSTL